MSIADLDLARTWQDEYFIELINSKYFIAAELRRDYTPAYIARWFMDDRKKESYIPAQILVQTMGYPDLRSGISRNAVRTAYENAIWADTAGLNRTGSVQAHRSRDIVRAVDHDGYQGDELTSAFIRQGIREAIHAGRWMEAAVRLESTLDYPGLLAFYTKQDIKTLIDGAVAAGQPNAALHVLKVVRQLPEMKSLQPSAATLGRLRNVFSAQAEGSSFAAGKAQECVDMIDLCLAGPAAAP